VKSTTRAQKTISFLALVLLAAPLGIAPGCAKDGELRQTLGAREGASSEEAAYDLGYRLGGRDRNSNQTSDPARHDRSYGPETEQSFATGYRDGFSGAPNRYGALESRQWMRQDSPD
jgi:hypothetical protein